jgi:hypothetical protein
MDWIWKCVKGFLFWTGLVALVTVFVWGSLLVYDIYHPVVAQEIEPIKLQVAVGYPLYM